VNNQHCEFEWVGSAHYQQCVLGGSAMLTLQQCELGWVGSVNNQHCEFEWVGGANYQQWKLGGSAVLTASSVNLVVGSILVRTPYTQPVLTILSTTSLLFQ